MKAGIFRLLHQTSYYNIIVITPNKIVNIGLDNNNAPVRCQAILETNTGFQQSGGVHLPVN